MFHVRGDTCRGTEKKNSTWTTCDINLFTRTHCITYREESDKLDLTDVETSSTGVPFCFLKYYFFRLERTALSWSRHHRRQFVKSWNDLRHGSTHVVLLFFFFFEISSLYTQLIVQKKKDLPLFE